MSAEPITLFYKEKKITLLPTAHVSKESAEMVREQIDHLKPDSICVELDQDRYNSLKDPQKYRETDIVKIIKENKVPLFLVNLVLANYQRRMAKNLDWDNLVNELLANVNPARLANNPCPIKREVFE